MPVAVTEHFAKSLPALTAYQRYAGRVFKDITVKGVSTIDKPANHSILFANKINESTVSSLQGLRNSLILVPTGQAEALGPELAAANDILECRNPRAEYGILLNLILADKDERRNRSSTNAFIHPGATIGKDVIIEDLAYIDDNVVIGDHCIIRSGARIYSRVRMGNNVIIGANSVVGNDGFGIEKDDDGNNIHIPHLGGIILGNHVKIGALNTVVSGTIHPTVVGDYSKTDDHVHIAHNCNIGRNCIITAGAIFSGQVMLKDGCWIGPNSSIKNKVVIGEDAFVGIGANVLRDVTDGDVVAGNPAKPLNKNK